MILALLGTLGHHGCQHYDLVELLINKSFRHSNGDRKFAVLGTHPALARVEPDIVVDRIWVSGQTSENDPVFMSSHWIGKCSHFSNMIIR